MDLKIDNLYLKTFLWWVPFSIPITLIQIPYRPYVEAFNEKIATPIYFWMINWTLSQL